MVSRVAPYLSGGTNREVGITVTVEIALVVRVDSTVRPTKVGTIMAVDFDPEGTIVGPGEDPVILRKDLDAGVAEVERLAKGVWARARGWEAMVLFEERRIEGYSDSSNLY